MVCGEQLSMLIPECLLNDVSPLALFALISITCENAIEIFKQNKKTKKYFIELLIMNSPAKVAFIIGKIKQAFVHLNKTCQN